MAIQIPKDVQRWVDAALDHYSSQDQSPPRSIETVSSKIRDPMIAYQLDKLLKGEGNVLVRAAYQMGLESRSSKPESAGAATNRHAFGGTANGKGTMSHPSQFKFTPLAYASPKSPIEKLQAEMHDAKIDALADISRKSAEEHLNTKQVAELRADVEERFELASLAGIDQLRAATEQRQAEEQLPLILRVLKSQMDGWRSYGQAMSTREADVPSKPPTFGLIAAFIHSRKTSD